MYSNYYFRKKTKAIFFKLFLLNINSAITIPWKKCIIWSFPAERLVIKVIWPYIMHPNGKSVQIALPLQCTKIEIHVPRFLPCEWFPLFCINVINANRAHNAYVDQNMINRAQASPLLNQSFISHCCCYFFIGKKMINWFLWPFSQFNWNGCWYYMNFTRSSYQAKHTISARMGFRAKRLRTNHHSQTS